MRRWFLFVFALHVLLSSGLLASVLAGPSLPGAMAQACAVDAQSATAMPHDEDPRTASADQHVADVQPEWPELLLQAAAELELRHEPAGPIAAPPMHLTPPPLEAPRRPPRPLHLIA